MVLPDERLILLVEKEAVECVAAKPLATTASGFINTTSIHSQSAS